MTTNLERIEYELKRAGYTLEKKDKMESEDDYVQAIGTAAYEICKLFAEQNHSGVSAGFTLQLIQALLIEGNVLTPLTNDPEEWIDVSELNDGKNIFQSKRKFSCFSDDNLQTYYDIENPDNKDWELDENGEKTGWSSLKPKEQLIRVKLEEYDTNEVQETKE